MSQTKETFQGEQPSDNPESKPTWTYLFKLCASYGLTPDATLDLNTGQVQAFIDGVEEYRFFQRSLLVEQAHWNRVYKQKRPKSPGDYIRKMREEYDKTDTSVSRAHQNDVDVAEFKRMESIRLQATQNKE